MKNIGVVRKLDELGRITLPVEIRKAFNLEEKDGLEIAVENDCIILRRAEEEDIFTGEKDDLIEYKGKMISRGSILELARIAGFL